MNIGDRIKFSQPIERGEESARFILIEINGDRGFARLVCDLPIAPVQLVRLADMVKAND